MSTDNAKIFKTRSTCRSKKPRAAYTRNIKILYLKEISIKFSRKLCCIVPNRRQSSAREVYIVLKHIILCEAILDVLELCFISHKLIVVICRRRICTIDLICRHSGHISALISDMGIAAVCCIRMEHNGIRCMHICRIEEADVLAVHLDGIRRDILAHIDDIGKTGGTRTEG